MRNDYSANAINHWFEHGGEPDPIRAERFKKLHAASRAYALQIRELLPDRIEAERALDKVQEVVGWGNAAISRDGTDPQA